MYFIPDIILSFFTVVQGICVDRNVLFIAMFWDFNNKIAYIVLQEIAKFWGRALWKSNNSYFSTSSLNIAVLIHPLVFSQNMCLNHSYIHIYLHSYDSNTGSVATELVLWKRITFVDRGILLLCGRLCEGLYNSKTYQSVISSRLKSVTFKSIHVIIPDIDFFIKYWSMVLIVIYMLHVLWVVDKAHVPYCKELCTVFW